MCKCGAKYLFSEDMKTGQNATFIQYPQIFLYLILYLAEVSAFRCSLIFPFSLFSSFHIIFSF